MRLAFGAFELDGERRQLFREGLPVALAPKPFALLELLVRRRPAAVSKDEILADLWEGAAISDTALTTVVNELRSALGESGRESRLVRTVHGYGYAFDGELLDLDASRRGVRGWLVGVGLRIPLVEGETVLGRLPGSDGSIVDPSVSRRHARVRASAEGVTIEDLGSRNGTEVRGERAIGEVALADGDAVRIGLVALRFLGSDLDPGGETPNFHALRPLEG
jgi:DNA-binding winged helix-turn-helix (wHTH) protein